MISSALASNSIGIAQSTRYFYMGTILGLGTWCSSDFGINDTHVQLASLLMVTLIYLCLRPSCLGNLFYIKQFFLYVADIKTSETSVYHLVLAFADVLKILQQKA